MKRTPQELKAQGHPDGHDHFYESIHGETSPLPRRLADKEQAESGPTVEEMLEAKIADLEQRLKEAIANEGMCHCGAKFSEHGMSDNHSPVEMPCPCPNEEDKRLLDWLEKADNAFAIDHIGTEDKGQWSVQASEWKPTLREAIAAAMTLDSAPTKGENQAP